jgi:hypothetical protein
MTPRGARWAALLGLTCLRTMQGDFIIAHCGGFHSFFNTLIKAVNLVAKLLGHRIRWYTAAESLQLLLRSSLTRLTSWSQALRLLPKNSPSCHLHHA